MFGLGIWELLIILVIVLLLFGANRLPRIGQALGEMVGDLRKINSSEQEGEGKDSPDADSTRKPERDTLSDLKNIASLGTPAGRRGLLGRFIRKGRF